MDRYRSLALLILRLGFGLPFALIYGKMKLEGGEAMWEGIGMSMQNVGITFAPLAWGFMAMLAEFAGGILIVLGLFTRPAAAIMGFVMIMASIQHLTMKDQWYNVATPLEMLAVFIVLIIMGAGKYSLDHLIFGKKGE